MTTKTHRQWTQLRMVFHQHPAYAQSRKNSTFKLNSPDVIQCTVHKDIGQAAGGFTATLVPRQEYLANINPNDWVEIFLDAGDTSKVPVMLASIDRISRRRVVEANGSTREAISISGRDYGKVFLSIILIADPLLGALLDQTTFNQDVLVSKYDEKVVKDGNFLNRPDKAINAALQRYHDGRAQCVLPASLLDRLAEYEGQLHEDTFAATGDVATVRPGGLALHLEEVRGRVTLTDNPNLGGNLWSLLEMYVNPVLNEMWVDTEGGLPTLHLEERPFSHQSFADLNAVPVVETEVTQEDLGKSDQDVRNWLRIYPDESYIPIEVVNVAGVGYANVHSFARSGIRKFETTTNAFGEFNLPLLTADNGPRPGLLEEWSGIIAEWNAVNDQLLAGSMTTRLRPDARIGRRLDFTNERTNERLSFYIEGITHNFQYPGASTTSFSLTRGVERNANALTFPLLKALQKLIDDKELSTLKELKFGVLKNVAAPTTESGEPPPHHGIPAP